jgi:hypothetical protein
LQDLNTHLENEEHEKKEGAKKYEAYMPMAVTAFLALVAVGLLIWRHGDPHAEKWIYSTFGAILGYLTLPPEDFQKEIITWHAAYSEAVSRPIIPV